MLKIGLVSMAMIVVGLTFCPSFAQCGEETFREMVVNLLKNERIPNHLKKQILAATIFYLKKERMKAYNDQTLCPPNLPKEMCQLPPTFYVWVRKLREEMIEEEINKSKPLTQKF